MPPAGGSAAFVPRRPDVAGVTGRTDLLRLSLAGLEADAAHDLFRRISGYDLVFGRLHGAGGAAGLLLSALEIPNPGQLRRDLDERFGGAVRVEDGLGAVSLIGFGLGSRPAALFEALQVLAASGIDVLDSFTGRESLSFLVDAAQVQEGVLTLHHAFVESRTAGPPLAGLEPQGWTMNDAAAEESGGRYGG
jgi:aspartate kinase